MHGLLNNITLASASKAMSTRHPTGRATITLTNAYKTLYTLAMPDGDLPFSHHDNPFARWERNFVQQMIRLRTARGMTQTDVAKALRSWGLPFHQQTVQRIEAGERPVRLNEAYLIADLFATDIRTMASSAGPSNSELRYTVDSMRRRAALIIDDNSEFISEWLEEVDSLVLGELVPRLEHGGELDDITIWGLAWAFKALSAIRSLMSMDERLVDIGGDISDSHSGIPFSRWVKDREEFYQLDQLEDKYWHDMRVVRAYAMTGERLYDEFVEHEKVGEQESLGGEFDLMALSVLAGRIREAAARDDLDDRLAARLAAVTDEIENRRAAGPRREEEDGEHQEAP